MHVTRVSLFLAAGMLFAFQSPRLGAAGLEPAPARPTTLSPAWPGPQPDGSVLLPNLWSLRPAGEQIALGDFPVNIAVHPKGRLAAVLHAGYGRHEILVVDLRSRKVVSRTPINETFYGLQFSGDGRQIVCSGAGSEVVHCFDFADGKLTHHRELRIHDPKLHGVVSGIALDKGGRIFAASLWASRVSVLDLADPSHVTDILLAAGAGSILPTPLTPSSDPDTAAAEKRAQEALYQTSPQDTFPYACCLDGQQQRLYVSLWAQSAVAVVDLRSSQVAARWPVEDHPCEMALTRSGARLFVANANRNTVSVIDTSSGKALETIWAALYPDLPPGTTPNSLALSPDEKMLFVANANVNAVAVFDISRPGASRSLGFIPVGWYPTSVRVTPDGRHLLVANGKGIVPMANPGGPKPGKTGGTESTSQYIGGLLKGTLAVIELPRGAEFEKQMAAWTAQVYRCSPLRADATPTGTRPANSPIPAKPGDQSPIRYCIYIIKENRTYDQIFGDMREGNGDPKLCLFPERVTPNLHKLARQFVLLDNFYVDAEVSADGHEWSMGAYATDFVEKNWPLSYGHNTGKYPYPSEGGLAIAAPAGGYLWDRAKASGVTYRSYGEFATDPREPDRPARAKTKNLQGHIDEWYHTFDMGYSDLKRADRFISELHRFEVAGEMPRLQIVRLPNDHTHGATLGRPTPTAYVAENDLAVGRVVDAIRRSSFWKETAIFVVEDDAQNGSDHVDAHRTEALVISPYTQRHGVDSTMYSTSSMLRTMELILGLMPMSQFDAAATPMFNAFVPQPDNSAYDAVPANVSLAATNTAIAWGGHLKMNFSKEDDVDDLKLNEVIWKSVRGADSPMPAPVRAAFVRVREQDGD